MGLYVDTLYIKAHGFIYGHIVLSNRGQIHSGDTVEPPNKESAIFPL